MDQQLWFVVWCYVNIKFCLHNVQCTLVITSDVQV